MSESFSEQVAQEEPELPLASATERAYSATKWLSCLFVVVIAALWFSPFSGGSRGRFVSHDLHIALDGSQGTYGLERVFAFAGQTLTVTYDCQIEHGSLGITVWRRPLLPLATAAPPLDKRTIRASTLKAQYEIPIDQTGFYEVDITPWRERNRYDLTYDVS
jgi:hypothetical protein